MADSQDYDQALQRHYAQGAPATWQESFISAYATVHPWEDLPRPGRITCTSWTRWRWPAPSACMSSRSSTTGGELEASVDFDPYKAGDVQQLLDAWLPLTFALNSLNRCMGQPDLYPFVLSPVVVGKLGFIHHLVHARRHICCLADYASRPRHPWRTALDADISGRSRQQSA